MIRPCSNRHGFGLLQLSFILAAIGVVISIFLMLAPGKQLALDYVQANSAIEAGKRALTGFVIQHSRLPCPDTAVPPLGVENCAGVAVGALPWATMGLPGPVVDSASIPLRYSVYRNPSVVTSADLAATPVANSYVLPAVSPVPPALIPLDLGYLNLYDFCQTLANAAAEPANLAYVHYADTAGGTTPNVAYILASGGVADSDGNGSSFDGLNVGVAFDDPARGRSGTYDDIVSPRQFADLQRELSCASLLMSMNYFGGVATTAADATASAGLASLFADLQAAIDVVNAVNGVLMVVNAGISVADATATEAAAIAAAAACLGLCPNLDDAVAAAAAGVVAANAALVAAIAASVLADIAAIVSVDNAILANTAWITAGVHSIVIDQALQAADLRGGLL
jgi:hypothetical protein